MSERVFDVESLLEVRDLSRPEIEARFHLSAGDLRTGASYQGAKGLERLANEASAPAAFYFRGQQLVVMYVSGSAFEGATIEAVFARLGPAPATLRSRAGKDSVLYLYPEQGLAVSASTEGVDFLEAFPPASLDRYRDELYLEPSDFVR